MTAAVVAVSRPQAPPGVERDQRLQCDTPSVIIVAAPRLPPVVPWLPLPAPAPLARRSVEVTTCTTHPEIASSVQNLRGVAVRDYVDYTASGGLQWRRVRFSMAGIWKRIKYVVHYTQ